MGTVATKAFDVAGTITLKCSQDDGGITFDRFSWIAAMMKRDDSALRDATWQASYAQVQQVMPGGLLWVPDPIKVISETLNEVVAIVKELHQLTLTELDSRFAHVGLMKQVHVVSPTYKEPGPENQHGLSREPLSGAMKAFSKHFDCNQGELTGQLRGITP